MKILSLLILVFTFLFVIPAASASTVYSGVVFPDGDISFADSVYSYAPGTDVGGSYIDPLSALGPPDYSGSTGAVSLGDGGVLIVQFTDNSLTTSGDNAADLWIFEIGAAVETFNVAISTNAINWIDLGDLSGQPTGIDIDAFAGVTLGELYSFVRLTDDASSDQTGAPFGEADIDAIGAISSGAAVSAVPLPAAIWLFGSALIGLVGVRKKTLG